MKTKKAGLLTKIVVLALLIYMSITLLNLRSQMVTARADLEYYQNQVDVQTQTNAALSDALENSDDPDVINRIAREKLGLVEPGEKIFYDITN